MPKKLPTPGVIAAGIGRLPDRANEPNSEEMQEGEILEQEEEEEDDEAEKSVSVAEEEPSSSGKGVSFSGKEPSLAVQDVSDSGKDASVSGKETSMSGNEPSFSEREATFGTPEWDQDKGGSGSEKDEVADAPEASVSKSEDAPMGTCPPNVTLTFVESPSQAKTKEKSPEKENTQTLELGSGGIEEKPPGASTSLIHGLPRGRRHSKSEQQCSKLVESSPRRSKRVSDTNVMETELIFDTTAREQDEGSQGKEMNEVTDRGNEAEDKSYEAPEAPVSKCDEAQTGIPPPNLTFTLVESQSQAETRKKSPENEKSLTLEFDTGSIEEKPPRTVTPLVHGTPRGRKRSKSEQHGSKLVESPPRRSKRVSDTNVMETKVPLTPEREKDEVGSGKEKNEMTDRANVPEDKTSKAPEASVSKSDEAQTGTSPLNVTFTCAESTSQAEMRKKSPDKDKDRSFEFGSEIIEEKSIRTVTPLVHESPRGRRRSKSEQQSSKPVESPSRRSKRFSNTNVMETALRPLTVVSTEEILATRGTKKRVSRSNRAQVNRNI